MNEYRIYLFLKNLSTDTWMISQYAATEPIVWNENEEESLKVKYTDNISTHYSELGVE